MAFTTPGRKPTNTRAIMPSNESERMRIGRTFPDHAAKKAIFDRTRPSIVRLTFARFVALWVRHGKPGGAFARFPGHSLAESQAAFSSFSGAFLNGFECAQPCPAQRLAG